MHQILGSLVVGVVAGEGARRLAWRPLFKGLIREGVRAQRGLAAATRTIRLETENLIGEARAELDRPDRPARTKK